MADVLFVVVVVAFFALAAAFVVACDRIIGPDELPDAGAPRPTTPSRRRRDDLRQRRRAHRGPRRGRLPRGRPRFPEKY